ncbi:hypothetical protein ACRAWD_07895 [Caulobacter segnis]
MNPAVPRGRGSSERDPHLIDAVLMLRPARSTASAPASIPTTPWRRLARGRGGPARLDSGRRGLFRLHRRGAEADRQVRPRPHDRALRAACAQCGPTRSSAWRVFESPSRACSARPRQVGRGHALPAHQPASAGTSPRARRTELSTLEAMLD